MARDPLEVVIEGRVIASVDIALWDWLTERAAQEHKTVAQLLNDVLSEARFQAQAQAEKVMQP